MALPEPETETPSSIRYADVPLDPGDYVDEDDEDGDEYLDGIIDR